MLSIINFFPASVLSCWDLPLYDFVAALLFNEISSTYQKKKKKIKRIKD